MFLGQVFNDNATRRSRLSQEETARKQTTFEAMSPDEQAAVKFEYLMSRHPRNFFCYIFRGQKYVVKKMEAWREELKTFALDLDLELIVVGNALTHALMRHHQTLAASRSDLMKSIPIQGHEKNNTAFVKVSDFYIALDNLIFEMNGMVSDVNLARNRLRRSFGVEI